MTKAANFSPAARRKARKFVLQALYQMQMTRDSASEVEAQFRQDYDMHRSDADYFHDLLAGVEKNRDDLDKKISVYIDRSLEELDAIELALLRMGTYELSHRIDIPFKVVINENINLAKSFGASESHKYINSILDRLSKDLRLAETEGGIGRD